MDNIINKKNEYALTSAQFQSLVEQKKLIAGSLYFIRDDGFDEEIPTIDLRGDHSFSELSNQNVGVYIILFDNDTANKPAVLGESALIFNIETIGQVKSIITIVNGVLYYSSNYGQTWTTLNTQNLISQSDIIDNLNSDDATKVLSATQGKVLNEKIEDETTARINADNLKINKSDIVDNLLSNDSTKVLSAKQGKVLQDEIENIKNSPDVVDIVAVYDHDGNTSITDILHYDTSNLGDNDIVRCLSDNNPSYPAYAGQSTYYKWHKHTLMWEFIGGVGDYYTKGQVNALLSEKANDNAVVKLTGDQTINGKKTFVKNLATQDNLVIVNSNGDTLSDLSGVVVKTGYNDLLFKGIWNFKSLPTNTTPFTATTNITAKVKENKPVVLYNISVNNIRIINYINIDLFSNAVNPTAQTNSGDFFTLSHNANEQVWTFNGDANLTLSDLADIGIVLSTHTEVETTSYSIDLYYLFGTGEFSLSQLRSINYDYSFCYGTFEHNDVAYTFNQLFHSGGGIYWAKNVEYDCGNAFTNAFSVSNKNDFNTILEMFEPETDYQTQSVASAYCIVYDNSSDSVKIGYGYFDGDNFITFSELSESISTREDSSQWTNDNFAKWNAVKNQFEDSGKSASDFATPIAIDTTSISPITLADNKWFRLGTIASLTLNNPATVSEDFTCMLSFTADTNIAMDYSALSITWSGDDIGTNGFEPVDGKSYDIVFYNNSATSTASLQAIVRGV